MNDMSMKSKRDTVVSKLMFDKSVIVDKYMANGFNDNVLSSIYMALSSDSRKLLLNGYSDSSDNEFHRIIGFQKDEYDENAPVTNELILNLCNNFINLTDCI